MTDIHATRGTEIKSQAKVLDASKTIQRNSCLPPAVRGIVDVHVKQLIDARRAGRCGELTHAPVHTQIELIRIDWVLERVIGRQQLPLTTIIRCEDPHGIGHPYAILLRPRMVNTCRLQIIIKIEYGPVRSLIACQTERITHDRAMGSTWTTQSTITSGIVDKITYRVIARFSPKVKRGTPLLQTA